VAQQLIQSEQNEHASPHSSSTWTVPQAVQARGRNNPLFSGATNRDNHANRDKHEWAALRPMAPVPQYWAGGTRWQQVHRVAPHDTMGHLAMGHSIVAILQHLGQAPENQRSWRAVRLDNIESERESDCTRSRWLTYMTNIKDKPRRPAPMHRRTSTAVLLMHRLMLIQH